MFPFHRSTTVTGQQPCMKDESTSHKTWTHCQWTVKTKEQKGQTGTITYTIEIKQRKEMVLSCSGKTPTIYTNPWAVLKSLSERFNHHFHLESYQGGVTTHLMTEVSIVHIWSRVTGFKHFPLPGTNDILKGSDPGTHYQKLQLKNPFGLDAISLQE